MSITSPTELQLQHQLSVDRSTGSLSAQVAIPLPEGRGGMSPSLALAWQGARARGVFGMGWGLAGLPAIGIMGRTGGLPRHDGTDIWSGSQGGPLVPVRDGQGRPVVRQEGNFSVEPFRPHLDQLLIRHERWTDRTTGRVHWRMRDTTDTVTLFGWADDGTSRIADPADARRIYQFLPDWTISATGDALRYRYRREDARGIGVDAADHGFGVPGAQVYLAGIDWANRVPVPQAGAAPADPGFAYAVRLDYGDHVGADPGLEPDGNWPVRPDPFMTGTAGFAIGTWRLCRRFLVFHAFAELGPKPQLTRSVALTYDPDPGGVRLTALTLSAHRTEGGVRRTETLPPVTLVTEPPRLGESFQPAPATIDLALPAGTATTSARLVDLYSEGLPGLLYDGAEAWYYRRNLGGGRFAPPEPVEMRPSMALSQAALGDFDGDGNMDTVAYLGEGAGRTAFDAGRGTWRAPESFAAIPRVEAMAALGRLDLTGSGRADVAFRTEAGLCLYEARGGKGYGEVAQVARLSSETDQGPAGGPPLATDPVTDHVFADMTGDGLHDQVLVRPGLVAYWPNLGNGRFGRPVVMANAPRLEISAGFSLDRVLLADLHGTGAMDILFLGEGEIRIYRNLSGRAFAPARVIGGLPFIHQGGIAEILDLMGDGVPSLVWSDPRPDRPAPFQVLPLSGPVPTGALVGVENGMGRRDRVHYGHSIRHYLADRNGPRPWRAALPQHRTVVDRTVTEDLVTGLASELRLHYRHGAYDGRQRSFAGFGEVETTEADHVAEAGGVPGVVPAMVRTFFAQGLGPEPRDGYWRGDGGLPEVPALTTDPAGLADGDTAADLAAALRGRVLRAESYAVGPQGPEPKPFAIKATGCQGQVVQPALPTPPLDDGKPLAARAILAIRECETVSVDLQGPADDPRISHSFALAHDPWGAMTLAASVAYPRRAGRPLADPAQGRMSVLLKRHGKAHVDRPDRLSLNLDLWQEEYAVPGVSPPARGWFTFAEALALATQALAQPVEHDAAVVAGRAQRLSASRWVYWNAGFTGALAPAALPQGEIGAAPLSHPPRLHHVEAAAFSDSFAVARYGAGIPARLPQVGYWREGALWWRGGETMLWWGGDRFFLPRGQNFAGGATVEMRPDPSCLFTVERTDAFGARQTAEIDYQAAAVRRQVMPNGGWTETEFSPFGVPVRAARGGTLGSGAAGTPEAPWGFDPLPRPAAALPAPAAVLADPEAALAGAAELFLYDAGAFVREGVPVSTLSVKAGALTHDGFGGAGAASPAAVAIAHFDGAGAIVQSRSRVEDGPAIARTAGGSVKLGPDLTPELAPASPRYRVSGWQQRNAKGEIAVQHEPFFSGLAHYEDDAAIRAMGTPMRHFFDAASTVVRTSRADGTLTRRERDAWSRREFDENDCVNESAWSAGRNLLAPSDPERHAWEQAQSHAATPVTLHLDPEGRIVLTEDSDGAGQIRRIATTLDPLGEVLEVRDPRGLASSRHVVDMLGRKVVEHHADSGTVTLLHDGRDQPVEVMLANGARRLIHHDQFGREVAVDLVRNGTTRRIETIAYADDPNDPATRRANLYGLPVAVSDEAGRKEVRLALPSGEAVETVSRLLDDPLQPVDWAGAPVLSAETFVTRAIRDAAGRPVRERRPDGSVIHATYGRDGGLRQLEVETEDGKVTRRPLLSDARLGLDGGRDFVRLGNGVTVTQSFDPRNGRLIRAEARRPQQPGRPALLQDMRYTYDPVGNVAVCDDLAHGAGGGSAFFSAQAGPGAERRYRYDAFYRLTEARGRAHAALTQGSAQPSPVPVASGAQIETFTQTYRYDAGGNLTRLRYLGAANQWTVDFWVDAATNRARPALGANSLQHPDPAGDFGPMGEMIRLDHLARLDWRHDQRLARAVIVDRSAAGQPDDEEIYLYGGGGERVLKRTTRLLAGGIVETAETICLDGSEIRRLWRGATLILERRVCRITDGHADLAEIHRWTLDPSQRETDTPAVAQIRYTLSNHLGSATLRLSEAAEIISYEEYLPFGTTAFVAGDDVREVSMKTRGFIARERDAATGLHHVGQRYYASWLCRFISPDPAGDADGPNLYHYAHNNPVTHADPSGLQTAPAQERGKVFTQAGGPPPDVTAAWNKLSAADRQHYRRLMDQKNFLWARTSDGTVVFGTWGKVSAIMNARLAGGEDVTFRTGKAGAADTPKTEDPGDLPNAIPSAPPPAEDDPEEGWGLVITARKTAGTAKGNGGPGSAAAPGTKGGQDPAKAGDEGKDKGDGGAGDKGTDPNRGQAPGESGGPPGDPKAPGNGLNNAAAGDGPGKGANGTGPGGGGTSEDPNARGLGDAGAGPGGGADPGPGGAGAGNGPKAGAGDGGKGGTETGKPGGGKGGSGRDKTGGTGGEKGGSTEGEEGGKIGGDPKGRLDGGPDGASGGVTPAAPGTLPGPGADPTGGNGGGRQAPAGSPPPETAGSQGGNGQQGGGARGGDARGTQGSGKGGQGPGPENARPGSGEGGGGKPTALDHVVKVAGYWNLEFSSDPKGRSGGIPGGMGKIASSWGQAFYLVLTVADVVLTVVSLGGTKAIMAGAKAVLKTGIKAMTNAGRKVMAALTVRNLRSLATRAAVRASIYTDNVFKWFAFDYLAQAKFFTAMVGKGGWRKALVESGPGRWFLYGLNGGAGATPNGPVKKFLGFWSYQKTSVANHGATLADKVDNFFHEGTHVLTDLFLYPVNGLRNKIVGGQPVFAVVNYLDEVAAYGMGRVGSLRVHALPMAPVNAFLSVYDYYLAKGGQAMARAAIGWSVAGLAAIGGSIWGVGRLLDKDDPPKDPQEATP